ncbi:ABC-three component system middle component 1 [Klebsiella aerogenes]
MIIDIIGNIFESNRFIKLEMKPLLERELCYVFYPERPTEKEEYFVVLQSTEQLIEKTHQNLEEKAQFIFDEINNSGKVEQYFEKNCTLIICQNEKGIDRLTALTIEEDLYNFKKNMIIYSDNELNELKRHLSGNGIEKLTNASLKSIINENNGESFIKFKNESVNNHSYYSLLMKVFLKLPFLTYSTEEKELVNLRKEIETNLSPDQQLLFDKLVSVEEWTSDNLYDFFSKLWDKDNDQVE